MASFINLNDTFDDSGNSELDGTFNRNISSIISFLETPNGSPDHTIRGDLLKDVVAFVEVRSHTENRSKAVMRELHYLGATLAKKLTDDVTHVIFKDGRKPTIKKAKKKGMHLVSVLWVESCKENYERVPESLFPALLPDKANTPLVPQRSKNKSMQPKDFEEEVASSAERGEKRRKRRANAEKWKILETPFQPSPLARKVTYVEETQPASPTPESPTGNITIPDTPPSLREKANSFNRPKLLYEDSLDDSPPSCSQTSKSLQRRLFEKNFSADGTPSHKTNETSLTEEQEAVEDIGDITTNSSFSTTVIDRLKMTKPSTASPMWTKKKLDLSSASESSKEGDTSQKSDTETDSSFDLKQIIMGDKGAKKIKKQKKKLFTTLDSVDLNPVLIAPTKASNLAQTKEGLIEEKKTKRKNKKKQEKLEKLPIEKVSTNLKKPSDSKKRRLSDTTGDSDNVVMEKKRVKQSGITEGENKNVANEPQASTNVNVEDSLAPQKIQRRKSMANMVDRNNLSLDTMKPPEAKKKSTQRRKSFAPADSNAMNIQTDPSISPKNITISKDTTKGRRRSTVIQKEKQDLLTDSSSATGNAKPKRNSRRSTIASTDDIQKALGHQGNTTHLKNSHLKPESQNKSQKAAIAKSQPVESSSNKKCLPESIEEAAGLVKSKDKVSATSKSDSSQISLEKSEKKTHRRKSLGNISVIASDDKPKPARRSSRRSMCPALEKTEVKWNLEKNDSSSLGAMPQISNDTQAEKNTPKCINVDTQDILQNKCPADLDSTVDESRQYVEARKRKQAQKCAKVKNEDTEKGSTEGMKQMQKKINISQKPCPKSKKTKNCDKVSSTSGKKSSLKTSLSNGETPARQNTLVLLTKSRHSCEEFQTLSSQQNISMLKSNIKPMSIDLDNTTSDTENNCSQKSAVSKCMTKSKHKSKHISRLCDSTSDGSENIDPNILRTHINIKSSTGTKKKSSCSSGGDSDGTGKGNNLDKEPKPTTSLVTTSLHFDEQDMVLSVVKKLGRFGVIDNVSDTTTHLISGSNRRTLNVLHAIARGCWIVSMEWVYKSLEAGKWLEEEHFELVDIFPASHITRLENYAYGPKHKPTLLERYGLIFVAENSVPPQKHLIKLVRLSGGQITACHRKADLCVGSIVKPDKVTVTEKWLMDCLTSQRGLPFDEYMLNNPRTTHRSPSPDY